MDDKATEALESLRQKFTSGNDVAVERAMITRAEYEALASAQPEGPVAMPWMRPQDLPWMVESLKQACILVKREPRNEEIRKVLHALEVELLNVPATPPAAPVVRASIELAKAEVERAQQPGADVEYSLAYIGECLDEALLATPSPAPEQREKVGLTDAELDEIWTKHAMSATFDCVHLLREAIAAHEAKQKWGV